MSDAEELPAADEMAAFAKQFQDAADSGGFDPFSLLTGQRRYYGIFLAPFTPSQLADRERFFQKGDGPLAQLPAQLQAQGLEAAQAAEQARQMLQAAQGMLLVLLADEQGLVPIQQLFFGSLNDAFLQHAKDLCGKDFPDPAGLEKSLQALRKASEAGAGWPQLVHGPHLPTGAVAFWTEVAERLLRSIDEGLFANAGGRLRELAYWAAAGLLAASADSGGIDGDVMYACARCACLGGDPAGATVWLGRLLEKYEPEDEALAVLLEELVNSGLAAAQTQPVLQLFLDHDEDLQAVLGGCYELELPRFRAHVAAQAEEAAVLAAAERLQRADKKSFRHDLNTSRVWQVAVADPGELLDTHAAAERIDRSTTFVAKRLEQGAIPFCRDGEQLRIPARSLAVWQAVVQRFALID